MNSEQLVRGAGHEGGTLLEGVASSYYHPTANRLSEPQIEPQLPPTIPVPQGGGVRRIAAFVGPGFMVAVGYMDPGNWATDLAAGSGFGYSLLFVVLLSSLMAMLLQALAVRLGVATGLDLAQACRASYSPPVRLFLYIICEVAIVACDLAEVVGTAIALELLFGLPLLAGSLLTAADTLLLLLLAQKGFRLLEAFIISLLFLTACCFAFQIAASDPQIGSLLSGLIPSSRIATDPQMLYIAAGIIGATVMPHNLYLHSAIVQTRAYDRTVAGRREAVKWATVDSTIALTFALFINAAILIVAAAAFHANGFFEISEIGEAYRLLTPVLGISIASTLFALALLASGLNSTVTATLAGQIVMQGFLKLRIPDWARRLITRLLAILPVLIVTAFYGESGTARLLVFSQVLLSMQLPFAVIPLIRFVSDPRRMGTLAISRMWARFSWLVAAVIVAINTKLLVDTLLA